MMDVATNSRERLALNRMHKIQISSRIRTQIYDAAYLTGQEWLGTEDDPFIDYLAQCYATSTGRSFDQLGREPWPREIEVVRLWKVAFFEGFNKPSGYRILFRTMQQIAMMEITLEEIKALAQNAVDEATRLYVGQPDPTNGIG
jgi:hypothetical protein